MEKMRVLHYKPYIVRNGVITDIRLADVIDYVSALDENAKHQIIDQNEFTMKGFRSPNNNPTLEGGHREVMDRYFCMASYRDKKPKLGSKRTSEYEIINKDVFEDTTCLYQYSSNQLIIEYNHRGVKANHIRKYFNQFLFKDENTRYEIELGEVESEITLDTILDSEDISSCEITLDISPFQRDSLAISRPVLSLRAELEQATSTAATTTFTIDENENTILNLVEQMASHSDNVGGSVRKMIFSKGRKRSGVNNEMNINTIKNFICFADFESECYASVKINFKERGTNKVTTVDLKNIGVFSNEIEYEHDSWESITEDLHDYYYPEQPGNPYSLPPVHIEHNILNIFTR